MRPRVKAPGSRGGKYRVTRRGEIRYDEEPLARVGSFQEWAAGKAAERAHRQTLQEEYKRILPQLEAHYGKQPPAAQKRIERLDFAFGEGRRVAEFIKWARSVVPDAFSAAQAPPPPAQRATVEPVQSLDWLPDTLYHGTRDLAGVLHHGLRVKDAYHALMGNPDVGWRDPYRRTRQEPMIEWAPYVWGWYRRLSPEGKRKLKAQVGEFSTADDLGERVGLIWTLPYKSTVGRGSETGEKLGATVVLDSKHLSVLGAFNADEIKGEIVLVVVPDTVVSDRTSIKSIIREVGRTRRCPHCGSERFHISQSPKVKGRRPITFDTGTCDKCNRQFPYSEGRQEEQQLT